MTIDSCSWGVSDRAFSHGFILPDDIHRSPGLTLSSTIRVYTAEIEYAVAFVRLFAIIKQASSSIARTSGWSSVRKAVLLPDRVHIPGIKVQARLQDGGILGERVVILSLCQVSGTCWEVRMLGIQSSEEIARQRGLAALQGPDCRVGAPAGRVPWA
jgi:hypothetical protein